MSSVNTRKVQKIQSQIGLIQEAMENIPALKEIGKEVEDHWIKFVRSMATSSWLEHRKEYEAQGLTLEDLYIEQTEMSEDIRKFFTNSSQNLFYRDKMGLTDSLAPHVKQYFEQKKKTSTL